MRWVGSCLHLPGGAAHPHALHWGFLCPGWRGASVGANVFRSVLGPWCLSRGTQPLSYIGSGPEQRGVGGGAGSALQRGSQGGWPGRALGCGPGRLERTVQIMGGWQGGTLGIRNMEKSHRKGNCSLVDIEGNAEIIKGRNTWIPIPYDDALINSHSQLQME